jgi:hypothetical protein
MSAWLARGGLEQLLSAGINIPTDNIKCVLVRLASLSAVKAITGATNATPIVITSASHGFSTGDLVAIVQVGGNTAANGVFSITVLDANTFSLQSIATGADVAGSGAYTSGGLIIPLNSTDLDNLDDVDAAAIAGNGTSANLSGKTVTNGVFDADDVSLTSVTAPSGGSTCDGILFYKDTGVASTSTLFLLLDQNGGTGLPITPNGGNISIQFSSGTYRIAAIRG